MPSKKVQEKQPTLFSLLTKLSPVERQNFGERRRKLKNQPGVREELLQDAKTREWRLEYWRGKKKIEDIRI